MITTSFGCLRPFTLADAESLARYANNPKIAANLRDGFPHPYTLEDAHRFIGIAMKKDPCTLFAVVVAGEAVGGIGLIVKEDVHRLTAEMGYWLGEPFWGRGIVPEAVKAVTDYGFDTLKLKRIFAEPFSSNPASCRVLEKAGFVLEGTLRHDVIKNGVLLDSLMYARYADSR